MPPSAPSTSPQESTEMRALPLGALSTVSFAALTLGLAAPATAQTPGGQVTSSEVQQCAQLPTERERQLCVQGQARPEGTADEAGDAATLEPSEAAEQNAESEAIVVTGSRIRRTVFNSPDPITIIDPELEQKGGNNSTAEILQQSPVASGSFQITSLLSAGSFVTNGGVGAQTLSLRGLGAERTLVLVNGRRAGPAGTRGAIAGFDLNVIPSALIQSVEILKTGASSIYGSDAIAGVVNLLTRKATDGLDIRGFASAPIAGGAENYNVSAAWGRDFGRGHFIAGVDYARRNDLRRGQRDYLECTEEYLFNPAGARVDVLDPRTGRPRCNTTRANQIDLVTLDSRTVPGASVAPVISTGVTYTIIGFNNPGERFNEFLPPVANSVNFTAPAGFFPLSITCTAAAAGTAANAQLCRDSLGLLPQRVPQLAAADIIPDLERKTFYADAGFELTDSVELVGEFLFNRRETSTDGLRQLFPVQFTGNSGTAAANLCTAARRAVNPLCDPTSPGDPLNAGFAGTLLINPIVPVATLNSTKVDYLRGVVGLKADFGGFLSGWNFDSYLQYSRSDGDYTNSRFLTDAIELQEYRTRLCAPGQLTRIRGVPCVNVDFTDPRVLRGEFTAEEANFLFGEETGNTLYEQLTAEASVSGNLFRLPAGPVGVAVGVQWRRDEIDDTPGAITLANNVFGQSVAGRTAGFSRSQEAFAEVQIPLVHNTPFIKDLTLSAAARLTNVYAEQDDNGANDTDNGNWTYKLGANWQVTDWLRFRGSYGTSYRAPALFEQFLANQSGFLAQNVIDPCINYAQRVTEGTLDSRIGQRCADLGLPGNYSGAGASSATIFTGGGIGVLDPETSTAKTASVVFTPDVGFWSGMRFSVAVDYFDITVRGQITTLGAANILFSCFNSETYPSDPTCSLFTRQLDPNGAFFGSIISVRNPYININSQRNRGVDLTARVTQDLGRYGRLSVIGQGTWQLQDRFELFRGFVADDNGEIGEPRFVGNVRTTYSNDGWSLFYGLDVVGGVSNEQDFRNLAGRNQQTLCVSGTAGAVIRGGTYCNITKFDPYFLHSASVTRDIGDRFTMTVGVNNIFDTSPPRPSGSFNPATLNVTGQTATFATQYDLIGRRPFVSVRAKF
jgi:iron complex outermembrane receptor protein